MEAFSTPFSLFLFLSIGAVALFSFLAVASWTDARRKERESYYKSDMLKKIAESSDPGGGAAVAVLREQARIAAVNRKARMRVQALVTGAVGLSLLIFLRALIRDQPVFLCGLIPLFIGIALYAGSYLISPAAE